LGNERGLMLIHCLLVKYLVATCLKGWFQNMSGPSKSICKLNIWQVLTSVFYLIIMAEDDKITVEKEYNIYDDLYASANFFLPARKVYLKPTINGGVSHGLSKML
jgi:hypothetical protein